MPTKIAYLTIDDAPSLTMEKKLDYLLSKQIPAIWFCCGNFMEERPDVIIRAIREGFVLGNHSYDHPHFSNLNLQECFSQIKRTDEIINALYKKAGIKRPAHYFRFPYGNKGDEAGAAHKQALQDYLRQLGYTHPSWENITYHYYRARGLHEDVDWYWTYDTVDWAIASDKPHLFGIDSLEKALARMDEDEPEGGRGLNSGSSAEIVLMHDHLEIADCFEPLVERLLAKGLRFVLPAV